MMYLMYYTKPAAYEVQYTAMSFQWHISNNSRGDTSPVCYLKQKLLTLKLSDIS